MRRHQRRCRSLRARDGCRPRHARAPQPRGARHVVRCPRPSPSGRPLALYRRFHSAPSSEENMRCAGSRRSGPVYCLSKTKMACMCIGLGVQAPLSACLGLSPCRLMTCAPREGARRRPAPPPPPPNALPPPPKAGGAPPPPKAGGGADPKALPPPKAGAPPNPPPPPAAPKAGAEAPPPPPNALAPLVAAPNAGAAAAPPLANALAAGAAAKAPADHINFEP